MRDKKASAVPSTLREDRPETVRALVHGMAEERALRELAMMAEMSLRELRQLCERPATCSVLDEMLFDLERLNLDVWELEEE